MRAVGWPRVAPWGVTFALVASLVVLLPSSSGALTREITASCGQTCRWSPNIRKVRKGVKIVWRVPAGTTMHSVTSTAARGSRVWKMNVDLRPGEKVGKVFKRRGVFRFFCRFHAGMTGYVKVKKRAL